MKLRKLFMLSVIALLVFTGLTPAAASAQTFDPDPPVAGEEVTINVGPIGQTVGYACVLFNTDGSCATYRICTSPSSVSYVIRFRSPTGEVTVVTLDSEFTPADPYPTAPNGGPSGEFNLTGTFTFPEAGEWEYQTQITRNNICGGSQTAVSQWTPLDVAEDANIPVAHPLGLAALLGVAAPIAIRRRKRKLATVQASNLND